MNCAESDLANLTISGLDHTCRRICLSNTDFKTLSKILTNRISNVLDKIVLMEQKCGVNGRKMIGLNMFY